MQGHDAIIVGAGLAGLCCARRLRREGLATLVLEGSDAVGGRVRTDRFEGFLLDRGFQVFLTAYPESRLVLDYDTLALRPFQAGAVIRHGGRFHRLADPWRQPSQALATALAPVGSLADKLRIHFLRRRLKKRTVEEIFNAPEMTTLVALREQGFSEQMIERFFRPFLGGVFLDCELETSSRMFEFVFKMFAQGQAAVPNAGMQAIPAAIARELPPGSVRLGARVARLEAGAVTLEDGERLEARRTVLATDAAAAADLLGVRRRTAWRSTDCLYFDAPEPPFPDPVLLLDGEGRGPANNVCVISSVAPGYAPPDRSLVSVSIVGATKPQEALEMEVRQQLEAWFGRVVADWRTLRHDRIARALPVGAPESSGFDTSAAGPFVCGDHRENASINGAMVSGRKAADAVLASLRG